MQVLPAVATTIIIQLFITANRNTFSLAFVYGVLQWECSVCYKIFCLKMSYDLRHRIFEGLFKNHTFTSLLDAALLWNCHIIIKWPFKFIYCDRNRPVILDRYESLQRHLQCKNEHFYQNFTSSQTPQQNSLLKCYGSHAHLYISFRSYSLVKYIHQRAPFPSINFAF